MEKLSQEKKELLSKMADVVRGLAMDAVQRANSGHPGLPMGCAELGAYLYGHALCHDPSHSKWINRDRLVLSAGHGSMWLYSLLHLSGFDLSLDDLKHFRQHRYRTPGHPEYGHTDGVEATTGPLGQGTGNAVGMALALKLAAARFNTQEHTLFDSKIFCLASDGDIMEGVSSEVSSIAGHLKLNNLIFIYDANQVTLDGALSENTSEDTAARYRAYGWDVFEMDGYDFDKMDSLFSQLRKEQSRPTLLIMHTIIGRGSPNKAGTSQVHGAPLGADEVAAAKAQLGLPQVEFHVPSSIREYFDHRLKEQKKAYEEWEEKFRLWSKANPHLADELEMMQLHTIPDDIEAKLWSVDLKSPLSGRVASHAVIQSLASLLPDLIGGSADLSSSDMTKIQASSIVSATDFSGRNIKFGVREFGMATIASGLALSQLFRPFIGTFLTFSDYMRNAIRLAALSKLQVIYQFTHDSIFLGEDGPTHQPIEQLASLRAIPNLQVIRPADGNEVKMAWLAALRYKGPTALILSRQALRELKETKVAYESGLGRGGYIVRREKKKAAYTLFATGSELSLALDVADLLERQGKDVRVISMPCFELFESQPAEYKKSVIGGDLGKRVSIEAASEMGWHKYIGLDGVAFAMESFGESAPASVLAELFGFQADQILERIL